MMTPTCPTCGGPTLYRDANGQMVVCKCMQVTFTTNASITPMLLADWNENMGLARNWKVTLYGHIIQRPKHPVPQAFQNAFKDGELEL